MIRVVGMVLIWAWIGTAALAEQLDIRVGEHPGFGRIVLEWQAPCGVETALEGSALKLTFERPLDALDLTPALERLPGHLVGFAPGERLEEVVLQLADGIRPNVWTSERLTIIDLYRPALDPPLVPVRISRQGTVARLVFDWPEPVSFGLRQNDGRVRINFGAPGRIDPVAVKAGLGDLVSEARADTGATWSQLELATDRPITIAARDVGRGRIQLELAQR